MTVEEDLDLSRQLRADKKAQGVRKRLLDGTLRLALDIAMRYGDRGVPVLDLAQKANVALWEALDTFAEGSGTSFWAHASVCVEAAMVKAVSESGADEE